MRTRNDWIVRVIVVLSVILFHAIALFGILLMSIADFVPDPYERAVVAITDFRRVFFGLFLLLLVDIAWLLWRRRASQRGATDSDSCRKCGYLLTGNVSGTCPECGQATFACAGRAASLLAPTTSRTLRSTAALG